MSFCLSLVHLQLYYDIYAYKYIRVTHQYNTMQTIYDFILMTQCSHGIYILSMNLNFYCLLGLFSKRCDMFLFLNHFVISQTSSSRNNYTHTHTVANVWLLQPHTHTHAGKRLEKQQEGKDQARLGICEYTSLCTDLIPKKLYKLLFK